MDGVPSKAIIFLVFNTSSYFIQVCRYYARIPRHTNISTCIMMFDMCFNMFWRNVFLQFFYVASNYFPYFSLRKFSRKLFEEDNGDNYHHSACLAKMHIRLIRCLMILQEYGTNKRVCDVQTIC